MNKSYYVLDVNSGVVLVSASNGHIYLTLDRNNKK